MCYHRIAPTVERFAQDLQAERHWYIASTFRNYNQEKGNFLSIAIDFRLTDYVTASMTLKDITSKQGRPLLDHILRPGFHHLEVFDRHPDATMLNAALRLGANPNSKARDTGASLWALYLCFSTDFMDPAHKIRFGKTEARLPWLETMQLLVQCGASLILPMQWLCAGSYLDELSWESPD